MFHASPEPDAIRPSPGRQAGSSDCALPTVRDPEKPVGFPHAESEALPRVTDRQSAMQKMSIVVLNLQPQPWAVDMVLARRPPPLPLNWTATRHGQPAEKRLAAYRKTAFPKFAPSIAGLRMNFAEKPIM